MDRKNFLKKSIAATTAATMAPAFLRAGKVKLKESDYDKLKAQVGFNHIPNTEESNMNYVIHRADTRGHADHGWLQSRHSFSFANYYHPERTNFGVLRVLNDDVVAPGKGFGVHPHDNMEIISIPLEGSLEHKDSMGNVSVIKAGDVQVMSAGTGIFHSEYNKEKDQQVKFLQIWLFPNKKEVTPRYDQISVREIERKNELYQILSPREEDQGVWIHQDAWFHLGDFEAAVETTYSTQKEGNGIYFFVLEGSMEIEGQKLNLRDGMGILSDNSITIKATSAARVLVMDVPMHLG